MKARIALAGLTAFLFMGASWDLNPLVTRLAQPAGPVPLGCDEALAPAVTPRVNVAEIPERETIVPVSMPPAAPPSRSLREELEGAHRALVRNDRPAFDEHLRAARAIVATYPAGGEKSRAEEVLWALNDAAVLWDAQFASPFFDETSDAYTRASRYAGYADAMRRSVFTDRSERRFYPAAESRDFVARVAAERLQRLGIRGASAPPPRVTRRSEERTTVAPAVAPAPPRVATRRHSSSSSPTPSRKTRKPAALAKAAPSSSPDPSDDPPSPAPAEPAPTAPPASAPSQTASADAPAPPVAEDVPVPMATDSATTTSAPVSPEPAPTSTAVVPAERRSVIIPALLILVGLGVLVVLFKASK